jgi:hypothetical protein
MEKLILELTRLYLLDGQPCRTPAGDDGLLTPALLQRHLDGGEGIVLDLVSPLGEVRALLIAFRSPSAARRAVHWEALCALANAMQQRLGLPAPAVSISGDGYGVWLSLATPVPLADAERLLRALQDDCLAELPDAELALLPGAAHGSLATLPPCLHPASGKWAAWINPGMGAAFAEEPGLDMAPPAAAQAQFLAGLDSITPAQLAQALTLLAAAGAGHSAGAVHSAGTAHSVGTAYSAGAGNSAGAGHATGTAQSGDTEPFAGAARSTAVGAGVTAAAPSTAPAVKPANDGLLLKDATLEDIVAWLHARGIEPTLRHALPK